MNVLQKIKAAKKVMVLVALFSPLAFAGGGAAQAPAEVINEAIEICKLSAVDDEVTKDELQQYLIDCLNDELDANEYPILSQEKASALIKAQM